MIMKRPTVQKVMTTDVVTVQPDTPFRDVVTTLAAHQISGVPVVSREQEVVGVVSEADLLVREERKASQQDARTVFRAHRPGHGHAHGRVGADGSAGAGADTVVADTAGSMMTSPAVTVTPNTTIVEAARLLSQYGIKRLPVVDQEHRLIGIVSRADLLRIFLKPDSEIRDEVVHEVIMRSLWQDPTKIQVEVHDGVVTLRGELELKSLIPIARQLTATIDGVVRVEDELSYERDDTTEEAQRYWR
jgi:CBS domain-containing protein